DGMKSLSDQLRPNIGMHPSRRVQSYFGVSEGRHKGEELVPQFCLSEIGARTGGTWFGETHSI
ncbi:MAG: hypothetical protein OXO50_11590, partial [Caldilineaceae bacterium]|nr:hypothetical protein [Caldilineaceae bacterium]